jgi:hypothetical protein
MCSPPPFLPPSSKEKHAINVSHPAVGRAVVVVDDDDNHDGRGGGRGGRDEMPEERGLALSPLANKLSSSPSS